MPFFTVMVHGDGIRLPGDGTSPASVGFYTSMTVRASSPETAAAEVLGAVARRWDAPPYVNANRGAAPALAVEGVRAVSLWHWLARRNGGHTFYPAAPG